MMTILKCPHCWQEITWSRPRHDWYCYTCRTHDTQEVEIENTLGGDYEESYLDHVNRFFTCCDR